MTRKTSNEQPNVRLQNLRDFTVQIRRTEDDASADPGALADSTGHHIWASNDRPFGRGCAWSNADRSGNGNPGRLCPQAQARRLIEKTSPLTERQVLHLG